MNNLYVGNKKIKSALIKTRVNTDFINATASDILANKKTIDTNYNEITGTMTITESLTSLTQNATATAADITSGKTGYKNGVKITGSAVRTGNPSSVIDGIIRAYKVANNNVINAGDFVKFVEEVCGCGYETTTLESAAVQVQATTPYTMAVLQYSLNKVLFLFTDGVNGYVMMGTVITINNGVITYSTPQTFSDISINSAFLFTMGNSKIVGIIDNFAVFITISNSDVITVTGYNIYTNSVNPGYVRNAILLDSNEIFVITDQSQTISYSRVKLVNNTSFNITNNIPTNRRITITSLSTSRPVLCRLNHNKLMLSYANQSTSSRVLSLDISDPNNVYAGTEYTLSYQNTMGFHSIQVENDIGMVSYYAGSEYTGTGYITTCKVNGSGLDLNTVQIGSNITQISKTRLCQLTPTLVVLLYLRDSYRTATIVPIKRTIGTVNFTYGTSYQLSSNNASISIDLVKIEDNKVIAFYCEYPGTYRVMSRILQINNETTVSTLLTIYDMNSPLTDTMVALATDNDTINGLSDGYGIGRLYGGDTINIIIPRTT